MEEGRLIGLCGNPNVGKSTLFNRLTGLHQHTGNWPGKTVGVARGSYVRSGQRVELMDIPGFYSLSARSGEEEIARDFVLFGGAAGLVAVCDATCLSRGLVLLLQLLEVTGRIVLCVNLMDEARSKGITVDTERLSRRLGIPVCSVSAADGAGMDSLQEAIENMEEGSRRPLCLPENVMECLRPLEEYLSGLPLPGNWLARTLAEGEAGMCRLLARRSCLDPERDSVLAERIDRCRKELSAAGYTPEALGELAAAEADRQAAMLAAEVVKQTPTPAAMRDRRLDRVLIHPVWGIPVMLALLAFVLWLTVRGAALPSRLLSRGLLSLGEWIRWGLAAASWPEWTVSLLVDGIWRTTGWVVAVMLPPMAIFFPLFTLLEDLGYLPRVAFSLDSAFARCSACGKQGLCMCMGLGCNAAGITGCRIIDSPRERRIAVLTNSFVPCNGRFPLLIALGSLFFAGTGRFSGLKSALLVTAMLVLGVLCTFAASRLLGATVLKGEGSAFTLELPPYRKPKVGKILVRSLLDRTVFVLGRALLVAAPAGLLLWVLANVRPGGESLLSRLYMLLDPVGRFLGMDGAILLAFVLALPANEIVLPVALMCYTAGHSLADYGSLEQLGLVLHANGWTGATALCVMLFSLLHWPCGTALLTVRRETGGWKWVLLAAALPTAFGVAACLLVRVISAV